MQSTPSVLKDCCSPALTGYPFGGLEIVTCRTSVKFALISRPDQQRVLRRRADVWARGECCVRLQ